ncbi:MAG TPA: futalosine hydrolase [Bacteroidales bacterium]|nr:futalosine hydrolase [Bacteroidales bacterium]
MSFRISIIAATDEEASAARDIQGIEEVAGKWFFRGKEIDILVTGVGTVATAWALTKMISSGSRPDIAIDIGIAGTYRDDVPLGSVVMPVTDCFADAGIDTEKGFLTLAEAGLQDPDRFPFRKGKLIAENDFVHKVAAIIASVNAVTVNTATGSNEQIRKISVKYNPDIETMEGAAFFYVCAMEKIPFLALRAVSNKVEPRNRENWNIPLALKNLSEGLEDVLQKIG